MSNKPEVEEDRQEQHSPDRELWLNVLFNGLQDAKKVRDKLTEKERKDSAFWMETEDFALVCQLAGVDPEWLREATDYGAKIPEMTTGLKRGSSKPRPSLRKEPEQAPNTVLESRGMGGPRKVNADALALPGRFGVQPPEADAPEDEAA